MSSLLRYKKTGGFVQLLSLIETFGPQKKDKFLEMIDAESVIWGKALREKMLTLERIFSWPDQTVLEVFKALPIKNLAIALQGLKEEQRARLMVFFSASEKRKLEDALLDAPVKPEEMQSNMVKLIELTRKMIGQGDLRPEKFDVALMIPEEYEAKLEQSGFHHTAGQAVAEHSSEMYHNGALIEPEPNAPAQFAKANSARDGNSSPANLEVVQLQRTIAVLAKESKALKEENRALREKLEQIKRFAA